MAKTTLKRKNKFGGVILPNFKTLYKATIIKTVFYQQKEGHINNRRDEIPEINSHIYGQMIFNKVPRLFNRERRVFLIIGAGNTIFTCRRMKLNF